LRAVILATLLASFSTIACKPATPKRVVLIVVDTLRSDFGGAETPTLLRLASSGTSVSALASFHQTSSSMAALWTGATPSLETPDAAKTLPWTGATWCGLARFGTGEAGSECLPLALPTIAERFRSAGYRTVGVASNNLLFRPAGFDRGFDEWQEVGLVSGQQRGESMAAFSRRAAKARNAVEVKTAALQAVEPYSSEFLFLYVHFMDVHDWYVPGDPTRPPTNVSLYVDAVTRFDRELDDFLVSLTKRGLLDDAVMIITADHGEALGEPHPVTPGLAHFANPSYEPVLAIPLILWPTHPEPSRPMRSEDLHRWLLERVGARPSTIKSPLSDDELFISELHYQTLRSGDWKFVRHRGGARSPLFNLKDDPRELHDLAASEPEVVARLTARIATISRVLAAAPSRGRESNASDADRLRALGYLQ